MPIARVIDVAEHRIRDRHRGKDPRFRLPVAGHLIEQAFAAVAHLVHGGGAVQGRRGVGRRGPGSEPAVAGTPGTLGRLLGGRRRQVVSTDRRLHRGDDPRAPRGPGVVGRGVEDLDRRLRLGQGGHERSRRHLRRVQLERDPRQPGAGRQARVPDGHRRGVGGIQHRPALHELAALGQRLAELRARVDPDRIVGRQERAGAAQQADRRGQVAAGERPAPGRTELRRRPLGQLAAGIVERPELRPIPIRLLEVEPEDLLELLLPATLAVDGLGPGHEPLVELRAVALEQAAVRRVPDQAMPEAERLVVGIARIQGHELLVVERAKESGHARPHLLGHHLLDRGPEEDQADDRGGLDHGSFLARQVVEARGEEGLDGRWHRDLGHVPGRLPAAIDASQEPLVHEHRHHLLDEQGVAVRRLRRPWSASRHRAPRRPATRRPGRRRPRPTAAPG